MDEIINDDGSVIQTVSRVICQSSNRPDKIESRRRVAD